MKPSAKPGFTANKGGHVAFFVSNRHSFCVGSEDEFHTQCLKKVANYTDCNLEQECIYNNANNVSEVKPCHVLEGDMNNMDNRAISIVTEYIKEHLDKSDKLDNDFEVYFVWKSKVLQNWKYLLSSTLLDGMYYELTYDGDKKLWYLDAYKKFENRCVEA